MQARRVDLLLYLGALAVLTLLSHVSSTDALTDVTFGALIVPLFLVYKVWRGSHGAARFSAGFHFAFGGLVLLGMVVNDKMFIPSRFPSISTPFLTTFVHLAPHTPVPSVGDAMYLCAAFVVLNFMAGVLMLRLASTIRRESTSPVLEHASSNWAP